MIEIKNLSKSFSNKKVLSNLNLLIEDGQIFGLVGINGSGKSTLLRLISGIYNKDSGSILIDGEEVYENEHAKAKIFFLPDEPFYSSDSTPLNIIDFYNTFYGMDRDLYIKYLNEFKLPLNKNLKNFSKGMKRQVFISLALAIKPKYLLLDEAFDGLDPLARLIFKKELAKLLENKETTLIISSHSLKELEEFCTYYGILDKMNIICSSNAKINQKEVHKYQFATKSNLNIDDFECIKINKLGSVITVLTFDNYEEFNNKIKDYEPLFIDEIEIGFEELFIMEIEDRGYME